MANFIFNFTFTFYGLDDRGKVSRFLKIAVNVPISENVQSDSRSLHSLPLCGRRGVMPRRNIFRERSLSFTASSAGFKNAWDSDVTPLCFNGWDNCNCIFTAIIILTYYW